MSDPSIDTATERVTFAEFTVSMQEAYLEDIRERRLSALKIYESAQASKKEARDEKLKIKAAKMVEKIAKKLAVADKAIDDIAAMFRDVKAIELEVGVQDSE